MKFFYFFGSPAIPGEQIKFLPRKENEYPIYKGKGSKGGINFIDSDEENGYRLYNLRISRRLWR